MKKPKIEIRPPKMSDLNSLLEMINSLVDEKAFITVQKKLTYKEEKEYLKKIIKDKNSIHLFLLIDGKVVGNSMVAIGNKDEKHIGEIGISLKKEARGMGLGEKLFKEVINKAIKKFKLRILSLGVHGKNKIAQNLYKKMGFEILGTIKGGVNHYNKYEDLIKMVKYLK